MKLLSRALMLVGALAASSALSAQPAAITDLPEHDEAALLSEATLLAGNGDYRSACDRIVNTQGTADMAQEDVAALIISRAIIVAGFLRNQDLYQRETEFALFASRENWMNQSIASSRAPEQRAKLLVLQANLLLHTDLKEGRALALLRQALVADPGSVEALDLIAQLESAEREFPRRRN